MTGLAAGYAIGKVGDAVRPLVVLLTRKLTPVRPRLPLREQGLRLHGSYPHFCVSVLHCFQANGPAKLSCVSNATTSVWELY